MRALALIIAAAAVASCGIAIDPGGTSAPRVTHVGLVTATPTANGASAASATPASNATVSASPGPVTMKEFAVPAGSGPHDVAPAADGGVWFTAQRSGQLGWLDPKTGQTKMIALGAGSAPHGVILGPDGAPWITDGGLNAIVRVEPTTGATTRFNVNGPRVDLNTAAFDKNGVLWWTGQSGWIGAVGTGDPGIAGPFATPRGAGPYGITVTPNGEVFFASLAGSYVGRIDRTHPAQIFAIDPPTKGQGARRVWSDSKGMIWVSEWNAGQVGRYDPKTEQWKEWKLPNSARPQAYAVFVDDKDIVWLSEWTSSSIVRFDPATETFTSYPYAPNGGVRQLHGRPGEVWGALSALDKLILLTTR
jgi:virginiamycin B lyase